MKFKVGDIIWFEYTVHTEGEEGIRPLRNNDIGLSQKIVWNCGQIRNIRGDNLTVEYHICDYEGGSFPVTNTLNVQYAHPSPPVYAKIPKWVNTWETKLEPFEPLKKKNRFENLDI